LEQIKKVKHKDLFNEVNNLISKYKKITHSEKNKLPKESEDDFPKKYLIKEKEEKDSSRNNTRKNLYKYLKTCLKDEKEKEKLFEKIVKIEEKLYEKYKVEKKADKKSDKKFDNKPGYELGESYTNRVLEILHNIKDEENKEFRQNIVDGKISPEELSIMDENDMQSKSKREKIQEKIEKKIIDYYGTELERTDNEGVFKCPKCGHKKTIQHEIQTRSADEPMTIFIHCLSCKYVWKI
jgi:transcription elongation factor S-II